MEKEMVEKIKKMSWGKSLEYKEALRDVLEMVRKQQESHEAINMLAIMGYATKNLWHISVLREQFNCLGVKDSYLLEILEKALTSDNVMVEINLAIINEAENNGLTQKCID